MAYRNMVAIEQRRTRVAALMTQIANPSSRMIVRLLGQGDHPVEVSRTTIANDIKAIRAEWQKFREADYDEFISLELAKIRRIEEEAWIALSQSKREQKRRSEHLRPAKGNKVDRKGKPIETVVGAWETVNTNNGAAAAKCLETLIKCREQTAKLLGLHGPNVNVSLALPAEIMLSIGENEPIDVTDYEEVQ